MSKTYDVFISYSHRADRSLGEALESGLKNLGRRWNQRRALEVFRDGSSLSASPRLWSTLAERLDNSRYAVLLLSPEADESQWVGREVEHFLSVHPEDHLLFALTAGTLVWDQETNDWSADSDAVPDELRGRLCAEPCWVDLRWARHVEDLTLRDSRFRDAVATLAAPVHGMSKDDLEGDDVRAHRRFVRIRRTAVVALIALLTLSLLAMTGMALFRGQTIDAREQTEIERELRREVEAQRLALAESNEDLNLANAELDTANAELAAANDELDAANAELVELEAFASEAAGAAVCAIASSEYERYNRDFELEFVRSNVAGEIDAAMADLAGDPDATVADALQLMGRIRPGGGLIPAISFGYLDAVGLGGTCSTTAGYPFRDHWSGIGDPQVSAQVAQFLPNCGDLNVGCRRDDGT